MVSAEPVLVCHRGASALAPENTLEAFRVAMQYGIDYSELDVYVGTTGELVVTHDPVGDPSAEARLPRLTDVFDLVRGRMGIYVELKGDGTAAALSALLKSGAANAVQLIVGSFRSELVAELRERLPELPSSMLFGSGWDLAGMIASCRELGVRYAHPCFRPIGPELVERLHDSGLLVMTPHTNTAAEALEFVNIGVDVIASDDPRILVGLRS
jgi:glycerophosphoryl diester phosphodiesterase